MSFFAAFLFMYDPLKKLGRVADFLATGEAAAERVFALTRPSEKIIENTPKIFEKYSRDSENTRKNTPKIY